MAGLIAAGGGGWLLLLIDGGEVLGQINTRVWLFLGRVINVTSKTCFFWVGVKTSVAKAYVSNVIVLGNKSVIE